ncbi:MAG: preprotein translocase subunit YajC [Clostridia bacterium]|nr:preprotein translocase subunit YajC [Clostridia bacterium]
MNYTFLTLADNANNNPMGGWGLIGMIVVYAVIFGAMYLIFIRPNRKKQKEEQKMRENLQVGDEILTIGGIYGRVISLKEDTMVIESKADRSKLTIARWALQQNFTVHDDVAKK